MKILAGGHMGGLFSVFKKVLKDEEGQTTFEYVLIIAAIAFIIFRFRDVLKEKLLGLLEGVFQQAETNLTDGQ